MYLFWAHQNDPLSLSFVNDEHTYDKKMAGSGRKIVIYQYVSFPIKLYLLYLTQIVPVKNLALNIIW